MNRHPSQRCTLCGTELTLLKRAIGTDQCADCHRGRSPAAQRKALFAAFAATPELSEHDIASRSLMASVGWLLAGGLVAELISIGTIMGLGAKSGVLAVTIGCGAGYFVGGLIVALGKEPLDVLRWGTFRNWLMGAVSLGFVASIFAGDALIIASMPVGLGVGLLAVAAGDERRKAELIHKLREYRSSQQQPIQQQPIQQRLAAIGDAYAAGTLPMAAAPQPWQPWPTPQQPHQQAPQQAQAWPQSTAPWKPSGGQVGAQTVVVSELPRSRG
jgi:hypothetical protein